MFNQPNKEINRKRIIVHQSIPDMMLLLVLICYTIYIIIDDVRVLCYVDNIVFEDAISLLNKFIPVINIVVSESGCNINS